MCVYIYMELCFLINLACLSHTFLSVCITAVFYPPSAVLKLGYPKCNFCMLQSTPASAPAQ